MLSRQPSVVDIFPTPLQNEGNAAGSSGRCYSFGEEAEKTLTDASCTGTSTPSRESLSWDEYEDVFTPAPQTGRRKRRARESPEYSVSHELLKIEASKEECALLLEKKIGEAAVFAGVQNTAKPQVCY